MTVNAGPEYFVAEKKYFAAKTPEDQMFWLEEMIRQAPKHKSSESFVANLKQRLKKFQEKQERAKKSGKTTKKVIRKEGYQVVLVGLPNSGKSSLLAKLTNVKPKITPIPFSTKEAEVGSLDYKGMKAQIVDMPSIGSEGFDLGLINTSDLILIVLDSLEDLEKIIPFVSRAKSKQLILINKSDLLSEEQLRKLTEKVKSKKLLAIPISTVNDLNIQELKELIMKNTNYIRIYLKEPGKPASATPMTLPQDSKIKDVAEKILKGFSKKIKETRITGPSSKFPNQKVGLSHILKDKDIVEFHTN